MGRRFKDIVTIHNGQTDKYHNANASTKMIEIKNSAGIILRLPLSVLTLSPRGRMHFTGYPIEVTIELSSGHKETWTETEPLDEDEEI